MKRLLLLCLACFLQVGWLFAEGHDIKISIPKMANKQVILAFYRDKQVLAADTAQLDENGNGAFKKPQKLAHGLYILYFSPSNIFDLIIGSNQNFSIKTDPDDIIKHIQFEGSPENTAFLDFQKFMAAHNQKMRKIYQEIEQDPDKDKNRQKYNDLLKQTGQEAENYVMGLIGKFQGTALATFLNAMRTPEIPDFSGEIPESTQDREMEIRRRGYFYRKAHYWDYINFQDSTLIRTPTQVFKGKLDEFFTDMVLPHPDSVLQESIRIIEKSRDCKPMFNYLTGYCFQSIAGKADSIMGMDAAYVKFSNRYILSGDIGWLDQKGLEKVRENVGRLQYNLIGETAHELKLPTLEGTWVSLHELKAPFTFLVFWEENCGHCKKQVPEIKTKILDKFKPYGLKVFAVHTQPHKEKWEQFVTEHELFDFINCWDPYGQANIRTYYNVVSTPALYLLDKDKKIIAKNISVNQMEDILKAEYKKAGIEIE